jgi:hypothetical protein
VRSTVRHLALVMSHAAFSLSHGEFSMLRWELFPNNENIANQNKTKQNTLWAQSMNVHKENTMEIAGTNF